MRHVLFICTGNYYRSRIAEILFNYYAACDDAPVKAFSRGLRLNPTKNTEKISPHAVPFLTQLKIPQYNIGVASKLESADLHRANRIIVMDETEHRPMMRQHFPEWEHKVEYWQLEDDYLVSPDEVLPNLRTKVEALMNSVLKN